MEETLLDKITSLAKRRGFIYQGSEIYGGLAGTWDYGPLGVALKNNIKNLWWKMFVEQREDMYGLDAAILMNQRVWETSGHVAGFSDPLVECEKCHHRFREDSLMAEFLVKNKIVNATSGEVRPKLECPDCGGKLGPARQFNMMFKTQIGAAEDTSAVSYLRPETAQGIFVNFKNIIDSFHPRIPFGIAQIGKAFRNEITPRDFIFRVREFEQMEIEYFVKPDDWEKQFEYWRKEISSFLEVLGLPKDKLHEHEIEESDRAFYSKRTIDGEFDYPFGQKELYGLAYRTDYDLRKHGEGSTVDLSYFDEEARERFVPHVIEPSFGLDRLVLALLTAGYSEDEMGGEGEKRVFLKLAPRIAPIKAAVFPLLKNKPELVSKARAVYAQVSEHLPSVMFDDNGNIGKRYRRQDEIGTPYCVTVDFRTLEDDTVTLRDRDTGTQERVSLKDLPERLAKDIS